MDLERLQETTRGLFPGVLGLTFLAASKDAVRAELFVRDDLCTVGGVLHGGAMRITREDGRLLALVTQTQMVLQGGARRC